MDELKKLEHLSLVSKVCTELENHLDISDKDLADFIIVLANKSQDFDDFKKNLTDAEANFSDSLMATLFRLITHMKKTSDTIESSNEDEKKNDDYKPPNKSDLELKKALYPFLAMSNNPQVREMLKDEIEKKDSDDDQDLLDTMAVLENLGHKSKELNLKEEKVQKESHRSRSTSRHRHRSRSKERRHKRSKSRSRSRRRESRDRDHHKERRRSRERRHRDRSNERSNYRSNDNRRDRSSSNDRRHDRRRNRSVSNDRKRRKRSNSRDRNQLKEPEVGVIYDGVVTKCMGFGCFVQLKGFRQKIEGMVHNSQLTNTGYVSNVKDFVNEKDEVKVKVVSISKLNDNKLRISLSMKDVDQKTGEDKNPNFSKATDRNESNRMNQEQDTSFRNPDRPSSLLELTQSVKNEDQDKESRRRVVQRISSPERYSISAFLISFY